MFGFPRVRTVTIATTLMALATLAAGTTRADDAMPVIRVDDRGKGFVDTAGRAFTPFGFNYDHDRDGQRIEDYWHDHWDTVIEDFKEMKALGANVVRVHLQFARFMDAPDKPNEKNLAQLARLLKLAEQTKLYLDVTGLGCYHKQDVPAWYDAMDEKDRWQAQANFWEAVARVCKDSPAVFCYDLMNEPVSPGGNKKSDDWLGPGFGGKHFVQRISLDRAGRDRVEIARAWIKQLVAAIRKHDKSHMITVGLVPWSLDKPGLTSGFVPSKIADDLDFIAMHLYPEAGKLDEAMETLKGFDVGKPIVVEEVFVLKCSAAELSKFMDDAEGIAAGWIGFYWGATIEELKEEKTLVAAITRSWLELFEEKAKKMKETKE